MYAPDPGHEIFIINSQQRYCTCISLVMCFPIVCKNRRAEFDMTNDAGHVAAGLGMVYNYYYKV